MRTPSKHLQTLKNVVAFIWLKLSLEYVFARLIDKLRIAANIKATTRVFNKKYFSCFLRIFFQFFSFQFRFASKVLAG